MEHLPLIIVAAVGGLLIVLVIIFIMSQKKQDRKDALDTQKMLETLKIDIKDAADDIDETIESNDMSGTSLAQSVVKEPLEIIHDVEEVIIEKPAETEPGEPAASEPDDPDLGMIFTQDELVIELTEAQDQDVEIGDDRTSVTGKEEKSSGAGPGKPAIQFEEIPTERESEMSELDALFEASTEVEEMVMSGQQSSMFDPDALHEDSTEGDLLEIDFSDTDATQTAAESEPAVLTPQPQPSQEVIVVADSGIREPPALNPEDQIRHEKAKRIARVIVNDIRNYNPDNLAEGIRIGSIMKTLGKEVERGRLLYIKRVPADIAKETNYYRDALVKILADGQPELLGF
ncbi:hypothetical protein JW823_05905 [bacterium]|nr:hypothetical protein [candidate division CSSED10-310 bacterium]